MASTGSLMVGMEVPIIGSDSVNWIEVSVPSSIYPLQDAATAAPDSTPCAPPTRDAASCSVIGDPANYFIWRINKGSPHVLELLELQACKEFPRIGMRIVFSDALCPFAYICTSEIHHASGAQYLLYALTVTGVAYLLELKNIGAYLNCTAFPLNEVTELYLQADSGRGAITAVSAIMGSLVIGRTDGSVSCFQLGTVDRNAPGFVRELRDDSGLGRLWGLMSRSKATGAVQDLVISDVRGKKLIFVLHLDGILRVWDPVEHSKVFSQSLCTPFLAGGEFARIWVGEIDEDTSLVPLAILYRGSQEVSMEMVCLHNFRFRSTGMLLEASVQNIPLEEGILVDVNLALNRLFVLKDQGLISYSLSPGGNPNMYSLEESVVADQLFQSPECSLDDLLFIVHSMYSSMKDNAGSLISSIFLRKLLAPGIYHKVAMRATFQDYNKHWKDSEFQCLTVDGLKKEILFLIEHEGLSGSVTSVYNRWKSFSMRYFQNWRKNNAPYGLMIEGSTGALGIIRMSSVSLCRTFEDIELLNYGSVDRLGEFLSSGSHFLDHENVILSDVLCGVNNIRRRLGKAALAVFYESLVSMPSHSCGAVVPYLLKVLHNGFTSSVMELGSSNVGVDYALKKEQEDHKNLRKFSVDMVLFLHALLNNATTWRNVLDIIGNYLKFVMPSKITQQMDFQAVCSVKASVLVHATSQVAESMFESAVGILLFLSYLVSISGQIYLSHDDITHIQLVLVPMIQEIVIEWLVIHFFCTTTCESPALEDFSSQLSSLQIDGSIDKRSWREKLGKCDFVLAFVLLLNQSYSSELKPQNMRCLPSPCSLTSSVKSLASWITWGAIGEASSSFFANGTKIAALLLRHGQYDAVELLLSVLDTHSRQGKEFKFDQGTIGEWYIQLHLLGCCFLAQAYYRLQGTTKERKLCEAVRCFFRASSGQVALQAVQGLSYDVSPFSATDSLSAAAWKLHYYEWAMQRFEQYSFNEGARQFALAALEQVDDALFTDKISDEGVNESAIIVRGRLWANVFKFSIDLNQFNDAYCALVSNPDVESKDICLRRLIIVLYERCATKVLCAGKVPFIGLVEQVERELAYKAERAEVAAKPNPYKLLYAFEMHRHNWRRAAYYMYKYITRLKTETSVKDHHHQALNLQERVNGLSAAINALHLVHAAYAWIEPPHEGISVDAELHSSKRSKKAFEAGTKEDIQPQQLVPYVDVEILEKEFILTSAEYLLSMENVKWASNGSRKVPSNLVYLLVQMNLHDIAFTVLLKFWKDSGLRRELEQVFIALSVKCCPKGTDSSSIGNDVGQCGPFLIQCKDDQIFRGTVDSNRPKGNKQWETLEIYLEKYKQFHPSLPIIVAQTLLGMDPQIELPLWLVNMFKGSRAETTFGMTGCEANPASLFRLYVDYGRHTEATVLLLDYIERLKTVRPSDIVRRKRPSAVWFPYTSIEQLWNQLEDQITLGHMIEHYTNLKRQLYEALQGHFKLLKVDSDDAVSCSQR